MVAKLSLMQVVGTLRCTCGNVINVNMHEHIYYKCKCGKMYKLHIQAIEYYYDNDELVVPEQSLDISKR